MASQDLQVVNTITGETINLGSATPQKISDFYIELNTRVKEMDKTRKVMDKHIKDSLTFTEEKGKERASFGQLSYTKAYRKSTNVKGMSETDKQAYDDAKEKLDELAEKYTMLTSYIKII